MKNLNYFSYPLQRYLLRTWKNDKFVHNKHWVMKSGIHTSSKNLYAQPTSVSHPHLLKNGEVTPGLNTNEYKIRRHKMMETIVKNSFSSSENNSAHLVVIPSASLQYMSENIPYPFRQNSDFLYLCGYKEPNSVLILHSLRDKPLPEHKSTIFVPKPSAHSIKWEGPKMDLNKLTDFLGIDEAIYMENLEKFLESFGRSCKGFTVWYDYLNTPFRSVHDTIHNFRTAYSGRLSLESPRAGLHRIRLLKSYAEADLMKKTCKIAAKSMKEVMKSSYPFVPEAHLQTKMDYECCMRGADYLAFPPVVAGGDRANTIHYIDNKQIIDDNDMVLMDAGCEYHGYASDMARTWPVNGKFTDPQRELYEVVLSVQEEIIKLCQSKISLDNLFEIMCKKLGKGLQELGIIPQSVSDEQVVKVAFELCPHHVSHYLGMDVHDTNLISRNIQLQSGMVITVEPGVYISKNNTRCPERFRGLCIRIEDDVLITDEGYEILTSDCPKGIQEIEGLF